MAEHYLRTREKVGIDKRQYGKDARDPSKLSSSRAQYSASIVDQAIMGCFFALQETQFAPRKVQQPEV